MYIYTAYNVIWFLEVLYFKKKKSEETRLSIKNKRFPFDAFFLVECDFILYVNYFLKSKKKL